MLRVRLTLLAVLAIVLVTAGCATNGKETKTIGANDAGKTVSLTVGDTLEVTLEGNPSTGFNWEADSLDTSVLKQVGESAFTPVSTAIGAGGQIMLRFEAVGSGETMLHLIYHRSWETGVAPEKTFDVTVQVGQ
jgi:inhibitor of cysteine peptidase